jgi:hypothetical protein
VVVFGVGNTIRSENTSQYPSGIGEKVMDLGASSMPEVLTSPNAVFVQLGRDYPGYIAKGLIANTEQPDTNEYGQLNPEYCLKLRMRVNNSTDITKHTPVVTVYVVRLSDGAQRSSIIYADQFSDYNYHEIPALYFLKSASGSLDPGYSSLQTIKPTSQAIFH